MEFREDELNRLPFNVIGNVDYIAEYPTLQNYPEFSDELLNELKLPFNNLFKYFVLLYSQNTPLLNIKDYNQRKSVALTLAVIDPLINLDIVMGRNPVANWILIAFFRMTKNNKWSKFCVFQDAYYNQLAKLQSGTVEPGERTKELMYNINTLESQIDEMLTDLMNQDRSQKLREDVFQAVEDARNNLRPEYIAQRIKEGDDPTRDWSPYAKG